MLCVKSIDVRIPFHLDSLEDSFAHAVLSCPYLWLLPTKTEKVGKVPARLIANPAHGTIHLIGWLRA